MSRFWRGALRGLGLALLVWILSRADWMRLGELAGRVELAQLWAVPLLTLAMIGVRAWRWNLLLRLQQLELPFWRAGSVYATGIFLGSFTPGRLGDLAKALYLRRERGVSWEKAVAAALADRLFDAGLMLLLGGWAIFQLGWWPTSSRWLLGLGAGGWIFAVFFAQTDQDGFLARLKNHPVGRFAAGLKQELRLLAGRVGITALLLTALAFGIYFSQTWLLARSMGLALSPADLTAAIVLIGLASFLPISIAGLGTREGILILILGEQNVPDSLEAAVLYSGLFFVCCFLLPALIGSVCWLKTPIPLSGAGLEHVIDRDLSPGRAG